MRNRQGTKDEFCVPGSASAPSTEPPVPTQSRLAHSQPCSVPSSFIMSTQLVQPPQQVPVQLLLTHVGSRPGQGSPAPPLLGRGDSGTPAGPQCGGHCAHPCRYGFCATGTTQPPEHSHRPCVPAQSKHSPQVAPAVASARPGSGRRDREMTPRSLERRM